MATTSTATSAPSPSRLRPLLPALFPPSAAAAQEISDAEDRRRRSLDSLRQAEIASEDRDLLDAIGLPADRHRKWKRIHSVHIRFTARIKSVNKLLLKQPTIRDYSRVFRNVVTVLFAGAGIAAVAVLNHDNPADYLLTLMALFVVWAGLQAWAGLEPKVNS
ncbi:hypothetical protein HDU98_002811 [Podochytrium sp. JEL0797]|nr:hypothetical protein HDU98_002811 [Podochytrium sp. JEL0797]